MRVGVTALSPTRLTFKATDVPPGAIPTGGSVMARKLTLLMPQKPQYNPTVIAAEEIPDDVKSDVDDAYGAWKVNPDARIRAEFDTPQEMALFVRQVQSYVAQHEPVWRYRKCPTKNLTDVQMDFKITDPLTKNETVTAEIRQATTAANAANATDTPPVATPAGSVLGAETKSAVEEALPGQRKGRSKANA